MSKKKRVVRSMHVPMRLWIMLAIIGVIGIWIASWFFICKYIEGIDERGMFGDMFGAVNALFSGLAFAGLIVTLLYQKEELKLQREELAQTREELKSQRVEFEEQNKTLKRQRFENTFFNILSLQQNIVNDLFYTTKSILIQKGGYGDFIDEDKFRGIVSEETYKRIASETEKLLTNIRKQIGKLKDENKVIKNKTSDLKEYEEKIKKLIDIENPTRELLQTIVDKIIIDKDKNVEIIYKFSILD